MPHSLTLRKRAARRAIEAACGSILAATDNRCSALVRRPAPAGEPRSPAGAVYQSAPATPKRKALFGPGENLGDGLVRRCGPVCGRCLAEPNLIEHVHLGGLPLVVVGVEVGGHEGLAAQQHT